MRNKPMSRVVYTWTVARFVWWLRQSMRSTKTKPGALTLQKCAYKRLLLEASSLESSWNFKPMVPPNNCCLNAKASRTAALVIKAAHSAGAPELESGNGGAM